MDHSRHFPPSSAAIWINCAGAMSAQESMAELHNIESIEGTIIHELVSTNEKVAVGQLIDNIVINEDHIKHISEYRSVIEELANESEESYIEKKLIYNDDMYGTSDFIGKRGVVLTVLDLKYGRSYVHPSSQQLLCYALSALKLFKNIKLIKFMIYQPRCYDVDSLRSDIWSVKKLLEWEETILKPAMLKANANIKERNAGSHCKHCRAKITCPQYLEYCKGFIEPPFALTSENIGKVIEFAPTFKKLLEQAVLYGTEWLQRGIPISGCKLVRKNAKTILAASNEIIVNYLVNEGYAMEDITTTELKKLSELKRVIENEDYETITYKSKGDYTITSIDDRRKAVATSREIFKHAKI